MDVTPEGRQYVERYQVNLFPHIAIIDPRTGRLLWRKEGWTQEQPVTAESFAEMAMDFCSRNSFDRPPQAPRPGGSVGGGGAAAAAASRPSNLKRPMHEMTEDEQLEAAMRASMEDASGGGGTAAATAAAAVASAFAGDDDGDDEVRVVDQKPAAKEDSKPAASNPNEDYLAVVVPDEPAKGARLQLRLPDGKRIVRRFAGTDSVEMLYAFVAVSWDAEGFFTSCRIANV